LVVVQSIEKAGMYALAAITLAALGTATLATGPAALFGLAVGGVNALTDLPIQALFHCVFDMNKEKNQSVFGMISLTKFALLGVGAAFIGASLVGAPFTITAALSLAATATVAVVACRTFILIVSFMVAGAIMLGLTSLSLGVLACCLSGHHSKYT